MKALGLQGIKGKDDRIIVNGFEAPWSAVGRVNRRTGGFCSGTLIGPRLVLTAAHCIWNKRTQDWFPVQSLHYVAGYTRGKFLANSPVEAFKVSPNYHPAGKYNTKKGAVDWALLVLKKNLGEDVGYFGLKSLTRQQMVKGPKVVQVGYSKDHKHVQTANLACPIINVARNGLAMHACDAVKGDSGSPIFTWRNGSFYVVGVHVSTMQLKGGQIVGGAVPSSVFFHQAKNMGAKEISLGGAKAKPPVETAQLILPLLGYDPGAPTGELTPRTIKAIRDYQLQAGMVETGRATTELIGALFSALAAQ